ncbi:unnamed protein product [Anisakis simplex]|uniref:Adiponectin receptor protein (inferred by orthology to a D. melanogaster protein) n=1 Tax=Anisakis simplex TaxID=6269 RepID=A0A0M3IY26_ANISI|nr:unnamed protein product [Anisakis simplex]
MLTVDRRQQHREGRCAAEEKASSGKKNDTSSSRTTTSKSVQKFEKGHRRAFSMPSSGGNRMTLSIDDGLHKRHVVRYKLQPHRHRNANNTLRSIDNCKDSNFSSTLQFWEARWKVTNFEFLPVWLQDNEYLRTGHRPPLPSFVSCFKSIFSLHTETGNIWTHMFGCVAFVGVTLFFLLRPNSLVQWPEKVVFSSFFLGAIVCLGMSFAFHTVQCHSLYLYAYICVLLNFGSFIPWIYYGFYCRTATMIVYMSMIFMLGIAAVIVSLWDKFAAPKFRPVRAGVFVAMGLSSIVPAIHLFITDGIRVLLDEASLHWLLLMGLLYLTGAAVYASRTPERCFPGKCDLLFQSHQLFHMFVVVAAFVHFHGICEMAMKKLEQGSCAEQVLDRYGIQFQPSSLDNWFGLDSL